MSMYVCRVPSDNGTVSSLRELNDNFNDKFISKLIS